VHGQLVIWDGEGMVEIGKGTARLGLVDCRFGDGVVSREAHGLDCLIAAVLWLIYGNENDI
jgi:hypothetical protein